MTPSQHSPENRTSPTFPLNPARTERQGQLKIFLGAAPGVGKTLAMLRAALAQRERGGDVVVGLVTEHGQPETRRILGLLESLSAFQPGLTAPELDLDRVLERKPELVLVDELAHSNATGLRHPKRWQDVEEILEAGIDVYTTLNVQHVESLNDEISHISGLREPETVPDTLVERACEIELVDMSPDELLERLRQGRVHLGEDIRQACPHYFQRGSLMALRQLALRLMVRQVESRMLEYREDNAIRDVWQIGERVLVCIGPKPMAERLIRAGKRLATELRTQWIVVYVETPELQYLSPEKRDAVLRMLKLAEQLGAETTTLSAPETGQAIIDFAVQRNITKIVMGKPGRRGWRRWLFGSVVDTVIANAHNINIYLLGSPRSRKEDDQTDQAAASLYHRAAPPGLFDKFRESSKPPIIAGYLWGAATAALCTLVASGMNNRFDLANLIMVYLLGVVFIATRFGRGPSILVSVLGVVLFDFLFVVPVYTLSVANSQYLFTLGAMLAVALVTSHLTASVRYQAKVAAHRERRAETLFAMSREMSAGRTEEDIVKTAVRHIHDEFGGRAVILLPNDEGRIVHPNQRALDYSFCGADLNAAQWVYAHRDMAGQGTNTLTEALGVYFPLITADRVIGVLALLPANLRRVFLPEQQRLLGSFLDQIARAMERIRMIEEARKSAVQMEAEKLRNSLLNAISHDLRTPLAGIISSAKELEEQEPSDNHGERQRLCHEIVEEAGRMSSLVKNILDMARLEAGAARLHLQWHSLEQLILNAESRLERGLKGRTLTHKLPRDLPPIQVDGVMLEQVLVNLLENIIRYTPAGTGVEIMAERSLLTLSVTVTDYGPGIPKGQEEQIFDKFHRGHDPATARGAGLGLAICKAIVEIHGGWIRAKNRVKGGAEFTFLIPQEQTPPAETGETEPPSNPDGQTGPLDP